MAGNTGGPWGGGGNSGGNNGGSNGGGNRGDNGNNGGGRKPGNDGSQIPEIDELVKKGQEQLRVLMGGRGGTGGGNGADNGGGGPALTRGTVGLGLLAAAVLWGMTSFYTVRPEQQSIELFLGEFSGIGWLSKIVSYPISCDGSHCSTSANCLCSERISAAWLTILMFNC